MQLLTGNSESSKKLFLYAGSIILTVMVSAACSVQSSRSDEPFSPSAGQATSQNSQGDYLPVNTANPGQPIELRDYLVSGKTTIFDMYSEYCGPCRAIRPGLEALAAKRSDIAIRAVDINRQGVRGIDWDSPLAQQYEIRSVPHFKIFDAEGRLVAEGKTARSMVRQMLNQ